MIIAVDFDGTIVEDAYPAIGKPKLFAFETLRELHKLNHRLILWTVREGNTLNEAVEFCRKNGIEFYAINKNFPEEILEPGQSRKLNADIFIDDRNVGGFLGWPEIWQQLAGKPMLERAEEKIKTSPGMLSKIKKIFS